MIDNFYEETFKGVDYTKISIVKGEYDSCSFVDCNFDSIHASNIQFLECEFINCNFSNTIVENTAFKDVIFEECKLVGVKFNECDPFLLAFQFNKCQLNFASFYKLKLQNTIFNNCSLEEVDFVEANLSKGLFDDCNLKRAIFDNTNLEKTNFVSSYNFDINPARNLVKGAKFSQQNVQGLLNSFQIIVE